MAALVAGLVDEQQLLWRARGLHVQVRGGPLTAEIDAALMGQRPRQPAGQRDTLQPAGRYDPHALERAGDGLRIEVADEGPGVDPADRARIFEPFYRGQTQPDDGGLPGTGIGLSIVTETVAAHGGTVNLLPREAGIPGARFLIELPHALAE